MAKNLENINVEAFEILRSFNDKIEDEASFNEGTLKYGELAFSALAVDVEWLDIAALRQKFVWQRMAYR